MTRGKWMAETVIIYPNPNHSAYIYKKIWYTGSQYLNHSNKTANKMLKKPAVYLQFITAE